MSYLKTNHLKAFGLIFIMTINKNPFDQPKSVYPNKVRPKELDNLNSQLLGGFMLISSIHLSQEAG